MKKETRLKKQLQYAKGWAERARIHYSNTDLPNMTTALFVLIAVEQLIEYLEMEKDE